MPKERTVNPVAAQHKADKKAALKKSKAQQQSQRNERLAKRNPERLERQVEELRELERSSGGLRHRDKEQLEHLERDLKAVRKAREVLGDKAPVFKSFGPRRDHDAAGHGRDGGKRRRDEVESDTDEEVRRIPMPRDTPPPVPRRPQRENREQGSQSGPTAAAAAAAPQQTVYSAEPQLRDIGKEVRRFVPAAVATKIAKVRPETGKLLEPEDLDQLEAEGYVAASKAAVEAEHEAEFDMMARAGAGEGVSAVEAEQALRKVEMEEVDDEDA